MRILKGISVAFCLCLAACRQEPTTNVQLPPSQCAELDSLLETLHELDSVLMNNAQWATCIPYLDGSLESLSHNQRPENKDCNYLDLTYKPDEVRLQFVETLRSRIEQDTIADGIYYLLRWMGIFNADPEISEFFAEEISYVATENPACYLRYLKANPDQEVMLLHSTKWNTMDLDSLAARFARLPEADAVVGFLRSLKEQKTDGI